MNEWHSNGLTLRTQNKIAKVLGLLRVTSTKKIHHKTLFPLLQTYLECICLCLFHRTQQNVPSKWIWEREKGSKVPGMGPPSEMPPYFHQSLPALLGYSVCLLMGFLVFLSSVAFQRWQLQLSTCPSLVIHAQQMVQIAWHVVTGAVLVKRPCQTSDGFFEVAHSCDSEQL